MTIQEAAAKVLEIQDASNITPVIRFWGEIQKVIFDDTDGSSESRRVHPLQIMMLSKVTSLMGAQCDGIGSVRIFVHEGDALHLPMSTYMRDVFSDAYAKTQRLAQIKVRKYTGPLPTSCNMCGVSPMKGGFVDGATTRGPWAIMCLSCFEVHGMGLGTGRGQKYNEAGEKVEG